MTFFDFLKIITLFSLAFFALFVVSNKKSRTNSAILLAVIYFFQALEMMNSMFYLFWDYWHLQHPWVFYSTEFMFFLWGPAIYFFFKYAIDNNYKWKKTDYLHTVPAVIHTIFLIFRFHILSNAEKIDLLSEGVMSPSEDFIIHLFRNISVGVYLFISALFLHKEEFKKRNQYPWLMFFLIAFMVVELIQTMHFLDLLTRDYNEIIYIITSIFWFSVAITTLFKSLQNPLFFLFEKMPEHATVVAQNQIEHKKEKNTDKEIKSQPVEVHDNNSAQLADKPVLDEVVEEQPAPILPPHKFKELLKKIESCVVKEKIYLDPELSLNKLAESVGTNSKNVSYIINEHFKKNFSDYINSHRIELAKEMLQSEKCKEKTILEIAYDVGFNSKATFNRAFSRFSDVSPSKYRRDAAAT